MSGTEMLEKWNKSRCEPYGPGKLGLGVCSENGTDIEKSVKAESRIGPFYYTNDKRHFVGV
jgi:hypothetical protein